MPSFLTWIQSKYNDFCQGNHQKSIKYTCNRLPKNNLLKKSSEIDFSSGDILTSKKSRFQRILNRVRGKKKREISPSYFITPWLTAVICPSRSFNIFLSRCFSKKNVPKLLSLYVQGTFGTTVQVMLLIFIVCYCISF